MSVIQQMYCTHCTHGSSALERRQGDLAARMLGYSVRAGSLEADALRQVYRQVERYVSYHLPRDTPGEQKLQLTASTAPRRLIFIPAAGAWQVIGHVCYRQRDTEGRPGSYFAHLLCRKVGDGNQPWTLLDALRLWAAPGWTTEDSADHAFVLSPIDRLDSLLAGEAARVDDGALLAFLRGDNRPFGSHLPGRWLDLLPASRIEVLKQMLGALMTTGTTRRQTLLVAVEPEAAALLFYGVGRLLPPGKLRESVSISTFEASADRLTTALAATTFSDPATAELNADPLRGRGAVLNTFDSSWNRDENGSAYAESMIRRLLDEGPESVDARLAMMAEAGPDRIEALEDFARTEQAVAKLFCSAGGADTPWQSDAALTEFARSLTRERFGSFEGAESAFSRLCGGASHAAILELAATVAPGGGTDRGIRFLLERLPEDRIAPFAAAGDIDDAWKVELLSARIGSTGRMPAGCEWLWNEDGQDSPLASNRRTAIALGVMGSLSAKAAVAMLSNLDASGRLTAVERLLDVCHRNSSRWDVFAEVVRRLDIDSLMALWKKLDARLFEVPDGVGGAVTARLEEILNTLHEHSAEFLQRLELLQGGRQWLTDPDDSSRLAAWIRCRQAMIDLAAMKESGGGWNQLTAGRRLESAAQRMTEAALEALPASRFEDDRQGTAKQERLRAIGRQVTGYEFLPATRWHNEAIWKKIAWRIEMGSWPSAPLRKLVRGPVDRQQMWIASGVAAAVVLGVLVVIALATIGTGNSDSESLVVERRGLQDPSERLTAESTPEPDKESNTRDGLSDGAPTSDPVPAAEAEPPTPEPIVSGPVEDGRDPPSGEDLPQEELPATSLVPEEPLVLIPGEFAATMSAVSDLTPPAVALVSLAVRGVDSEPLPDWIVEQFILGAVIQEKSNVRAACYIDLSDLQRENKADLHDGVDSVLVQFRFSRKPAESGAESAGMEAASFSWAEVPIHPAQRYDIRFILSPQAVGELKRLATASE